MGKFTAVNAHFPIFPQRSMRGKAPDTLVVYLLDAALEAWIPNEGVFESVYEGPFFSVAALDAFSILVSKAVKAPAKNRVLVARALELYGEALESRLRTYQVDVRYFLISSEKNETNE